MRIVDVHIHQYGPLEDTGAIRLEGFNLFWGKNEDGKTLLLDALLRLLWGKQVVRVMKEIQRISEEPDGYVRLLLGDDEPVRFPDAGTLAAHLNLPVAESLNLLVIRNSDLALAEEGRFLDTVRDRLFNLNTARIETLKAEILRLARLTPTGHYSNREEDGKLKTRLEQADRLIAELNEFATRAREQQLDRLDLNLVARQEQLDALEEQQKRLELARERERFEQSSRFLKDLKDVLRDLAVWETFTEEDYRQWVSAEQTLARLEEERRLLQQTLDTSRSTIEELRHKVRQAQRRLDRLREEARALQQTLKPLLEEQERLETRLASLSSWKPVLLGLMGAGGVTALFGLAGLLFQPSALAIWSALGGSAALILGLVGYGLGLLRTGRRLRALEVRIAQVVRPYREDATLPQGTTQALLKQFQDRVKDAEEAWMSLESSQRAQVQLFRDREEQLRKVASKTEQLRALLFQLQKKSGVSSSEQYRQRLEERKVLEMRRRELTTRLQEKLGSASEDLEENLSYWEQEVERLKAYEQAAPGIRYRAREAKANTREMDRLRQEIDALREALAEYRDQLRQLENACQEVLGGTEGHMLLRGLNDVEAAVDALQQFCRFHDTQRQAALLASSLLQQIQEQEKEKLQALFGPDQRLSCAFQQITGGLYPQVAYDGALNRIHVVRRDGKRLLPEQLSGGTFDQLYFAVRVALAQKLLADETGFFLLDDPFLKSDTERLRQQMQMLLQLAEKGWQIIYFSAKQEIHNLLAEDIASGRVRLIELKPPRFKLPEAAKPSRVTDADP